MTTKPPYVVHTLAEKEMTVDWFFGRRHYGVKVKQFILIVIGWFFAVLPVVVTAVVLGNRDDETWTWWSERIYTTWDRTLQIMAFFFAVFVVAYLALFVINLLASKGRNKRNTFDEERLSRRLALAEAMYDEKFGPRELRAEEANVQIQPYGDVETFELRGRYRMYGGES
jgi:hypothetical protein